MDLQTLNPCL